jgi:3-hydroxyisobutyrate dehydrogenase-like beta-hydroxyacid dehydrogenase
MTNRKDSLMADTNTTGAKHGAKETVGFVGLGMMGHGIAKNIADKGYPLTFLGRKNRAPVDDMKGRGATEVKTAIEVG